jgi:hypothetical protein
MADVAQLVEQSIRNRQVIGSSPIVGSNSLSLRSKPPRVIPFHRRIPHLWHAVRRVVGLAAYLTSLCGKLSRTQ